MPNLSKAENLNSPQWPSLSYNEWKSTLDTLHLWTQIFGKIKLEQNQFINHWWEVALYITSRGLTTGRIPYKSCAFEASFDFLFHKLVISTSRGNKRTITLKPQTVAAFYKKCIGTLQELDISIMINSLPSEIPNPIPFERDTNHKSYDKKAVAKWHQIQLQTSFILDHFRTNFRGKSSPVQFFWGGFDLTTTRFSGRKLLDRTNWPNGYKFMRYAENEENFACGFWPGDRRFPHAAFYTYLYPAPKGYETMKTGPMFSYFDAKLSECILPYEKVRKAKDPGKEILNFFQTTYSEYAKLAGWNIEKLHGMVPEKYITLNNV